MLIEKGRRNTPLCRERHGVTEIRTELWVRQWGNPDLELAKFSKHYLILCENLGMMKKVSSFLNSQKYFRVSVFRLTLWLFITITVYFPLKYTKSFPRWFFYIIFPWKENNISVDVISICRGLSLLFQAWSRTSAWGLQEARPGTCSFLVIITTV